MLIPMPLPQNVLQTSCCTRLFYKVILAMGMGMGMNVPAQRPLRQGPPEPSCGALAVMGDWPKSDCCRPPERPRPSDGDVRGAPAGGRERGLHNNKKKKKNDNNNNNDNDNDNDNDDDNNT